MVRLGCLHYNSSGVEKRVGETMGEIVPPEFTEKVQVITSSVET